MNTENFYDNQQIKNYREFCKLAGEKDAGGKQKKIQLERWLRFLDYYKEDGKNSYVIKHVREVPIDKQDGRQFGNNSIFNVAAYELLIHLSLEAVKEDESISIIPLYYLKFDMEFCGDEFSRQGLNKFSKDSEIHTTQINHLYAVHNEKYKAILKSTINLLKKKDIIESGNICSCRKNNKGRWIELNEKEDSLLKSIKDHVLNKLGTASIFEIYSKNLSTKFYKRVFKIFERLTGYKDISECVALKISKETLENKKEYLLSEDELSNKKRHLNKIFVDSLIVNTLNYYDKHVFKETYAETKMKAAAKLNSESTPEEKDEEFVFREDFFVKQMYMIRKLIDTYEPDLKLYPDDLSFVRQIH